MNLPASLLLLLVVLIGLPLTIRLLSLGRRRGCLGLLLTLLGAAIPAAFLLGSFYLDTGAPTTSGTVAARDEPIHVDTNTGTWMHYYDVQVRIQPDGAPYPQTIQMDVSPILYDQLHIGQTVPVHYIQLANLFLFTRLAQQSTLNVIPWNLVQAAVVLIGAVLIVLLWRMRRFYGLLALLAWLVVLALLVLLPQFAPRGKEIAATAQVSNVYHITEIDISTHTSNDRFDTPQPFDIVQLSFTPQDYSEPVIAVDVVDSGSVRNLETGGHVPILYPLANPRQARIEGAAYTHYWKNPIGIVGLTVGVLLLLGLIWIILRGGFRRLGGWFLRRAASGRNPR